MDFLVWLEGIRTPFLDALISAVTHLGEETLFMAVSLIFFWCVDKHRGYYLLFCGFCGTVCIQILKMIFRIPRPWVLDPNLTIVESARAEATGYSFPSGHTQCATTLYGGMARSSGRTAIRTVGILLCLAIAFSRMYLGVHTPKDVLVSLAIGFSLVLILYPIIEASRKNPRIMYGVIAFAFLLSLGNLLFVELYAFPANTDPVNLNDARQNAWKLFAAVLGMCILYPVERKWIRFETHAVWWAQIMKLIGGIALILAVRMLLKQPLNALFGVNVGGAVRYFLMVIVAGIVWPITFRFFAKLGKKPNKITVSEK